MRYFKTLPVIVEACRADPTNSRELIRWGNGLITGPFDEDSCPYFLVDTGHGIVKAIQGDWIVKGAAHEFYPKAADVFGVTYEEAERTS